MLQLFCFVFIACLPLASSAGWVLQQSTKEHFTLTSQENIYKATSFYKTEKLLSRCPLAVGSGSQPSPTLLSMSLKSITLILCCSCLSVQLSGELYIILSTCHHIVVSFYPHNLRGLCYLDPIVQVISAIL